MYGLRMCCAQFRRDLLNREVHADYELGIIRADSGPLEACPYCRKPFRWDAANFR